VELVIPVISEFVVEDVFDVLRYQFGRVMVFEYKYREGKTVVALEQLVADTLPCLYKLKRKCVLF
jgi:hypothetical protein